MQRTVSKSLSSSIGINGGLFGNDVGVNGGSGTLNNQPSLGNALAGNIPAVNQNSGAVVFGFNTGAVQVSLLLKRWNRRRGAHARGTQPDCPLRSGSQVPRRRRIPSSVAQEEGAISVEFKPFGIELNFIPRVVDKDVINLELLAAVSAIDPNNGVIFNGFQIDAFTRRETSTTVEMRDGDSFAIAGPDPGRFPRQREPAPVAGRRAGPGRALPQRRLPALADRACHHHHGASRHTLAGRRLRAADGSHQTPVRAQSFLYGQTARSSRNEGTAVGEVAKQDFGGSYGYVLD